MSGTLETNSFRRQETVLEAHLTRPEDGWKQTITNNPNHTITSFNNIESIVKLREREGHRVEVTERSFMNCRLSIIVYFP